MNPLLLIYIVIVVIGAVDDVEKLRCNRCKKVILMSGKFRICMWVMWGK